jgi:hypothetical protein
MKSRVWREGIIGWIILLAIFATGTPAASQSCVSPPEGLVSWWAADGGALDSMGANHGMLWNGASISTGITDGAFNLDGLNDYVEVPDEASLNLTEGFTVEAWINPRSLPGKFPAIVKKSGLSGGRSSTTHGFSLAFRDGKPQVGLNLYFGDHWTSSALGPVSVGTNTWSHVVATYDGAYIRLYVNGTEIGPATPETGTITPSDNPLNIGRDPSSPSDPDRYFDGLIDEVRIYNRALTVGEIGSIYQARSAGMCHPEETRSCVDPPADLVSWWPADGSANDLPYQNDGFLQNGVTFATGFVGRAFDLDGFDHYVEVPDAPSLNLTNAITIETWINPRSVSNLFPAVVKKSGLSGGRSATTHGYSLALRYGAPQVFLGLYIGEEWGSTPPGPVSVGTNTWSHVAATYDGTWIRMYVNGTEIGPPTYKPGTITISDNPLNIGRDPASPDDPERYFDGLIDDVRIYNRALTADEIRSIYWAREAGVCPTPDAICQDVTVSAGPFCTASASIDNGSFDPDGDPIILTQTPEGPYPLGGTLTTLTATDPKGLAGRCDGTITVVDITPPSLVSPPALNLPLEPGSTVCELFVSDAQLGQATVEDNCPGGMTITRTGVPADHLFPLGTTTLTYTATDAAGNTATSPQTVTVTDPTIPGITDLSVSPEVLWPANGQMVDVSVGYDLKTNCSTGPMACSLSVSCNEPIDGSDYSILDEHHLLLRADIAVKGNDRIYTITVTCSGGTGSELEESITVLVPDKKEKKDKKK